MTRQELNQAISVLATETHARSFTIGICSGFYLYFAPGKLAMVTENEKTPEGMELATGEKCPVYAMTRDQVCHWIVSRVMSLPILRYEEV